MPFFVGKAHNFVFYRGAIPRSHTLDAPAVHGRAIQIVANNIVRFGHGHCEMATELFLLDGVGVVGKGPGGCIAGLFLTRAKVDAACIDARWGAGFEPPEFKTELREAIGCFVGGLLTCSTRAVGEIAHMNEALEEGARGQNDGFGGKNRFGFGDHAFNASVFDYEVFEQALFDVEVWLIFDDFFYAKLVCFFVRLCPGCLYGGSSALVEHAKLQARGVNIARHFTAQRVNFAHHVAFCYAANGRVARHLRDGVEVHGQQQCFTSHACRGQRGFCARMSTADNNDVVFFFVDRHIRFYS